MSWNKPSSVLQPPPKKSAPPSLKRGLLAGLVVVALGALGLYLFSGGEATSSSLQKKERGLIKEVTPAPAPKVKPVAGEKEKKELPPQRVGEVRDGWRLLCDGRLQKVSPHPIKVSARRSPYDGPDFDDPADQMLANIVMIEPGEGFVGDSAEDLKGFNDKFVSSVMSKIEIKDTDSDYDKEVKQAVIDLKKELVQRLKQGEDPEQLLIETRNQLQELGAYREELSQQVYKMMNENKHKMTDDDLADLVNAANKMLEERGSKPLAITSLFEGAMQVGEARRNSKDNKTEHGEGKEVQK